MQALADPTQSEDSAALSLQAPTNAPDQTPNQTPAQRNDQPCTDRLATLIRPHARPLAALALCRLPLPAFAHSPSARHPLTPRSTAPPTQQAAPIERQPPSDAQPGRPRPGRRGMMRGNMRPGNCGPGNAAARRPQRRPGRTRRPANFRGSAMMHRGFHGGPGGGFHGPQGRGGGGMGDGHFGPGGMWWKNPMVVQRLTLTPDQVTRMDAIFQKSRIDLIDLKANLEKQEVMLEPLLSANPPDTAKATLQIDKVADARASLEKANAKMLLSIRTVLTADQWTKLRTHPGPTPAPGAPGPPAAQNQPDGSGPGSYGGGYGRRGTPGGPNGVNMDDTRP
jgi:Spy/CpxP family protein refolding chaperone